MFFKKDKNESIPEWLPQMQENQTRWFVFLEKLTQKAQELCDAAIPELQQVYTEDTDIHKRAHGSMLSGINGQLEQMRKKAAAVYEEKIHNFFYDHDNSKDFGTTHQSMLRKFRSDCQHAQHHFEENLQRHLDRLSKAAAPDWEKEYQKVLDEFDAVKNKFACKQCSSIIPLEKIYFISTYITCGHCQTQNTFNPSSQALMLESIGRNLAEQRTAHLQDVYHLEVQKERDLYHKMHENRVFYTDSDSIKKTKEEQNEIWALERKNAIAHAPELYEIYLRAMFNEWNNIVPDLTEQNEKFYNRLLSEFRK